MILSWGDDDGVLFIPLSHAAEVADVAATIRDTERSQAAKLLLGTTFRTQAHLGEYLAARDADPGITFRQHLRALGGEIEE
ncbi:MAG: Dimethylmenaquinone methyltransferase [Pseudarthrobacter sp.]|nr:Dimethylmenaquinone methyltransferase [Pseudarthrobacter sp.]